MKKLTLKRQLSNHVNKYKLAVIALERAKLADATKAEIISLNKIVRLHSNNLNHFIDSLEI